MANIAICEPTGLDNGSISTNRETVGYAIGNLLESQPSDIWRSTQKTDTHIIATLDKARPVQLIFLGYTNLTSSARWRITADTDVSNLGSTSSDYHSGWIDVSSISSDDRDTYTNYHAIFWLDETKTYQNWRIDIADSTNDNDYIQAGRLYVSEAFVPERNINYGWTASHNDIIIQQRSNDGHVFSRTKGSYRILRFAFAGGTEDNMWGTANKIDRIRAGGKDIFVIIDPEKIGARLLDWSIYGVMGNTRIIGNPSYDLYQKSYSINELI